MQITLYTDGSSKGNPGPGGWGVYIEIEYDYPKDKNREHISVMEISGGQEMATNNQMELMAGIKALEYLKRNLEKVLKDSFVKTKNLKINIKTDSQYMKNGIEIWIKNWEKNNWKGSNKKEVLNKDLWQKLLELKNFINNKLLLDNYETIKFEYVKAHIGINGNEIADRLANKAADNFVKY